MVEKREKSISKTPIVIRDASPESMTVIVKSLRTAKSNVASKTRSLFSKLFPARSKKDKVKADKPRPDTAKSEARVVEINLSLPSILAGLRTLKVQAAKSSKRTRIASAAACLLVIILILVINLLGGKSQPPAAAATTTHQPAHLVRGTPKYSTVLPAGKNIEQLGGWARVSPPTSDPVYAYVDHIGDVQIDVSEQPLPPNFKSDTDNQIAKLAQNYSANVKLTASGTTVYVGTSASGPQSVILTKKGLLILIKSTSLVSDANWVDYVNSLD